jgi:DNA-binding beta-propeller fold protein YncE
MMLNAEKEGKETHWAAGQKTLKGQIDITSQDDRFVVGTYTSPRGPEKFIAMITPDGKYLYASDSDGFFDCKIANKDTLEIVYRHVKATDSVVATSVAKRQK